MWIKFNLNFLSSEPISLAQSSFRVRSSKLINVVPAKDDLNLHRFSNGLWTNHSMHQFPIVFRWIKSYLKQNFNRNQIMFQLLVLVRPDKHDGVTSISQCTSLCARFRYHKDMRSNKHLLPGKQCICSHCLAKSSIMLNRLGLHTMFSLL